MDTNLNFSFLEPFSLSFLELDLYKLLLEKGASRASMLVKHTKKPRATVYLALQNMTQKGIVGSIEHSDAKQFYLHSPEYIENILWEKKDVLEKNIHLFREMLPLLKQKTKQSLFVSFEYHDTKESLQYALKDILLYPDSETFAFWPISSLIETLGEDFFREFNKKRIKEKIYTKALWPSTRKIDFDTYPYLGTGKEFFREIRIPPKEIDCTMGYWIYGEKVVCVSSKNELFGFTVQSKEFIQMLKTQFIFLWENSIPVKRIYGESEKSFLKQIK